MKNSDMLEAEDARAIVRLLGEVCANPGDHIAKKHQLMDGICELINADRWGWGLAAQMEPGKPSVHISLLHGGFTEETYAAYTQAYSHPEMTAIHGLFAAEIAEKRCHLTRLRQQMDPEEGFKKTGAYAYWQAADIDGVIMSLRPLDSKTFSILGIYRRFGADLFTSRENRIAHILLSEVPSLHTQGWPDDHGITLPDLSTRQRVTLGLLVQGYKRDQIADHLKLSLHTVNDYVKVVFKHFGARSQAELIVRFQAGDGGDQ
ncbi:MAG: helix-turn-helix transcriptional regulator [Luteolibacter sp.]